MLVKVDLHEDVVWFIRHRCSKEEQLAFLLALEAVRKEPIAHSEALADPRLSRYMLRFFRFADCIALFKYDVAGNRIKVMECRRVQPSKRPRRPK
jgi:hypothetical protein